MVNDGSFTIGRLAKNAGVNIETVRYYERIGLLKRPSKSLHGFRQYEKEHLLKIKFIKRAQELGFSLKEIKKLLSLRVSRNSRCKDIKAIAREKVKEVEHKIKDLQRIKNKLEGLVKNCDARKPTKECPIIDVMEGSPCCAE